MRTFHRSGLAPLAAAFCWLGIAAAQLSGHDFQGHYDARIDYVRESTLMLAVASTGIAAVVIGRAKATAKLASIGVLTSAMVAVTAVAIGMASGEEPEWFFNVMGPALLVMFVSLVALVLFSWNSGIAPRWALILIALTPLSIPAFWMGFSVIPAAAGWVLPGGWRNARIDNGFRRITLFRYRLVERRGISAAAILDQGRRRGLVLTGCPTGGALLSPQWPHEHGGQGPARR